MNYSEKKNIVIIFQTEYINKYILKEIMHFYFTK